MKTILALSLIVGVALCNSSAFFGWSPNQEFLYHYESQMMSGLPGIKNQYSGMKLASDVIIQSFHDYSLRIKFVNPKYVSVNDELQIVNGMPQINQYEQEIPEAMRQHLTKPFEAHLKTGVIESLFVEGSEPVVVTNIKKSLLSQIQIDLTASRRNEIPSELPNDLLEGLENTSEMSYFSTEESTLVGDCQTEYTIHKVSPYQVQEIESELLSSKKQIKSGIMGQQLSNGKQVCEGKKYFEITKTMNLDNCKQRPVFQSFVGLMPECDFASSSCTDYMTQLVSTKYIVCGSSTEEFVVRKSETINDILVNPLGLQNTEEKLTMSSKVTMTLLNVKQGHVQTLSKPINAVRKNSLVYQYPVSSGLSSQGSKTLSLGQDMGENGLKSVLPKPELLTSSVVLPSPLPFHELKHKIVMEISHIASEIFENTESCSSSTDLVGRLSAVTGYLRPVSFEQLKKIESELLSMFPHKTEKHQMVFDLFHDILSMIGSNPSVMLVKEKIENQELTGLKAVKVLQDTIRSVRTPTEELLKQLFGLVKSLKFQHGSHIYNTALVQLAELINNACIHPVTRVTRFPVHIFGLFCTEKSDLLKEEIIPHLVQELMESNKDSDRLLYVTVLGKIGHKSVLKPLVKVIEGQITESSLTRSVAVYSLKNLAKVEPTLVKPVLLKLIDNIAEHTEVRIAAVSVLPWTKPTVAELQKIAVRSWFEPSKQVTSFIYSTIKSLSETIDPELKTLSSQAKNIIQTMKPMQAGIQFSKNTLTDNFVQYLRMIHNIESTIVKTSENLIPSHVGFTSEIFSGSWKMNGLTFNLYTKGMDAFLNDVFARLGLKEETSTEVIQQLQEITNKLNIHLREKHTPQTLLQFSSLGYERFFTLDKDIYSELISKVSDALSSVSEKITSKQTFKFIHSNYLLDFEIVMPTMTGFPILMKHNVPTVFGIKGEMKYDQESYGIQTTLIPVTNMKMQSNIGFVTPFKFYGTGVDASLHSVLPVTLKFSVESKGEVVVSVKTPEEITKNVELLHVYVKPYTVIKSLEEVKPFCKSQNLKTIVSGKTQMPIVLPIGQQIGVNAQIKIESDNKKMLNIGNFLSKITQFNGVFNAMSMGPFFSSVRQTSIQITYNPITSKTKEIQTRFTLISGKKMESGESKVLFPSQHDISSEAEQSLKNMCSYQSQQSTQECVEQKIQQLESRRQSHSKAKSMLEKLSQQGICGGLHIQTSLKSTYEKNIVNTILAVSHEKHGKTIKSHVDLDVKTLSKNVFSLNLLSKTEIPDMPYRWNIHSILGQNVELKNKIQMTYNVYGQQSETAEIETTFLKTEEQKSSVQQSQEMKSCEKQIIEGHELSSVCMEIRHQASALDKVISKVKIPKSWSNSVFFTQISSAVGSSLLPHMVFKPKTHSSEETFGKTVFETELTFDRTGKVFQGLLLTPSFEIQMNNVLLPKCLQKIFPLSTLNSVAHRLTQRETHSQAPPSCRLHGDLISTFDNLTYSYEMSKCEHLLFKDCSSYSLKTPVAVLAKKSGSDTKSVKILSGVNIVELKTDEYQNNVKVVVNGEEKFIPTEITFKKHSSQTGSLELTIKRFQDGVVLVETSIAGLKVFFNGKNIEIVTNNGMHNRACGLCGDLNVETSADLKTPEECIMSKPHLVGYSYMIKGSHCSGIPQADIETYEHDKRQCIKAKTIPTSLESFVDTLLSMKVSHSGKAITHIVEAKKNQICISKKRVNLCGKGQKPVKIQPVEVSFTCIRRTSPLNALSIMKKAQSGEEISQISQMPTHYSKMVMQPIVCSKSGLHNTYPQQSDDFSSSYGF